MVSASDLQRDSSRIIKMAKDGDQPVIVLKNNKPVAVLMNAQKLQKLIDRIKELEERNLRRELDQAEEDIKAGKYYTTKDFSEFLDDQDSQLLAQV